MVSPALPVIGDDLHIIDSSELAMTLSIFVLAYAVGPLFLAPLSEMYGRWPVYNVCNVLFLIFSIACALSPSLAALIVFRLFSGVAGCAPLTIGAGTIADLVPAEKRGAAMSGYVLGPLFGPVIGPIGKFSNPQMVRRC